MIKEIPGKNYIRKLSHIITDVVITKDEIPMHYCTQQGHEPNRQLAVSSRPTGAKKTMGIPCPFVH